MKKYAEIWFGLAMLAVGVPLLFFSIRLEEAKKFRIGQASSPVVELSEDGAAYFDLGGHTFYSSPGFGVDNAVYHSHGCKCGWMQKVRAK